MKHLLGVNLETYVLRFAIELAKCVVNIWLSVTSLHILMNVVHEMSSHTLVYLGMIDIQWIPFYLGVTFFEQLVSIIQTAFQLLAFQLI